MAEFVTVTGLDTMIGRFIAFEGKFFAAEIGELEAAMHRALEISQETVHVVSGNLKATGRVEGPHVTPVTVEVDLVYGGEVGIDRFVDYAVYEEALHPFVAPAGEAAEGDLLAAVGLAWAAAELP